jgi:acetate kinase
VPHHLQKNQAILAVNIGSSSLKFSLYPIRPDATDPSIGHAAFSGSVQGLEPGGTIILEHSGQTDQERPAAVMQEPNEDGLQAALRILKGLIENHDHGMTIAAVAHRVVHGGDHFSKAVVVTAEILKSLHILDPLAPLHQPHNLRGIQAFTQYFPGVPQVACFDTAFLVSLHLHSADATKPSGGQTAADGAPWKWVESVCLYRRKEFFNHDGIFCNRRPHDGHTLWRS